MPIVAAQGCNRVPAFFAICGGVVLLGLPVVPPHPPRSPLRAPCRKTLVIQGREVFASRDPLEAEMWVSYLLGMFSGLPLIGEPDPAEAVGGRLVSVAQKRRTPEAQMCLRALAAVASRGLAERARKAIAGLGTAATQVPAWTKMIGTARVTSAWRASDL